MEKSLYTRPDKPFSIPVTKRTAIDAPKAPDESNIIELDASTHCFVTPVEVSERVADYLQADNHKKILEPQAGTGNLIHALMNSDENAYEITAVEQSYELVQHLKRRFRIKGLESYVPGLDSVDLIHDCFLNYAKTTIQRFDFIMMNPPFFRVYAKRHFSAAVDLLNEGGRIVAIVPVTFDYPDCYEIEILEAGTFSGTKVMTKIIEFEK